MQLIKALKRRSIASLGKPDRLRFRNLPSRFGSSRSGHATRSGRIRYCDASASLEVVLTLRHAGRPGNRAPRLEKLRPRLKARAAGSVAPIVADDRLAVDSAN